MGIEANLILGKTRPALLQLRQASAHRPRQKNGAILLMFAHSPRRCCRFLWLKVYTSFKIRLQNNF